MTRRPFARRPVFRTVPIVRQTIYTRRVAAAAHLTAAHRTRQRRWSVPVPEPTSLTMMRTSTRSRSSTAASRTFPRIRKSNLKTLRRRMRCKSLSLKSQTSIRSCRPMPPIEALNPKNYAFVPAQWLNKIPAAGAQTVRSESFGMILHQPLVERRQEVV